MLLSILSHGVCVLIGVCVMLIYNRAQARTRKRLITEIRTTSKSVGRRVKIDPTATVKQLRDKLGGIKAGKMKAMAASPSGASKTQSARDVPMSKPGGAISRDEMFSNGGSQ